MDTLARVQSYSDLRSAVAMRRHELGLTQLEVDDIAGLQSGYLSKLECGLKNFGPMSLDAVLGALGLEIVLVRSGEVHRALSSALAVKAS
jgi:transcriptional regulator with XRE-family HTH domain